MLGKGLDHPALSASTVTFLSSKKMDTYRCNTKCGKATTEICGRETDRFSVISESVNGSQRLFHNGDDRTYWKVRPNWISDQTGLDLRDRVKV